MTAPDLYRGLAGNAGVVGIDEEEKWKGESADAVKAILRSGYGEGVEVTRQRQRPDGNWERDHFPIYSPKALASINPLDDTTSSRTIVVGMRPALRPIPEFDATRVERWRTLRDDLYLWGLGNAKAVHKLYNEWTVPGTGHRFTKAEELYNRSWEISAPLVVVTDYIGGDAFSKPLIEWLTEYFKMQRTQSNLNDFTRLITLALPSVMKNTIAREGWWYTVKTIHETFLSMMDEDVTDRIKTSTVAKLLRPLGFSNQKPEKGGVQVQILEEDVRRVYRERRIEPRAEDEAWFEGKTSYQQEQQIIATAQTFEWEETENGNP